MRLWAFAISVAATAWVGTNDGGWQTLDPQNVYVLHAAPRQATTSAPVTLTFREFFLQGKKQMVRQTEVTIPNSDIHQVLTMQVRSAGDTAPAGELLFVLDVRRRNIPATTRAPLVLTLASGAEITVPSSAVDDGATMKLRYLVPTAMGADTAVTSGAEPSAGIAANCAKDWPDDFQMRKYCQDKQIEGVAALQRRTMTDSADHRMIRNKCATDWSDDFQMRDYCELQQLKALAAIGR